MIFTAIQIPPVRGIVIVLPWSLLLILSTVSGIVSEAQETSRDETSISVNSSNAWRDIDSEEIVFERLDGRTSTPVITALAGSMNGEFVAAAGDDHAIRIIHKQTGKTVQTVIGHLDWVQALVFSYPQSDRVSATDLSTPDLYSAGHDGRVLRWKFSFPLEAEEVAIVPYAIRSISISSDKQLLAIGGFSNEVLLYDVAKGLYVNRLPCTTNDQRCVRFSPDGNRILSGNRQGEILVWDSNSGELLAQYQHHAARIHTAAFSADGNSITSAGEDRRIVRYNLLNKQVDWQHELALSKLMSLCLINDQLVAVAGADNGIRLFDAESNVVIAEMSGHHGTVAVMAPCGDCLASGSFDTTVRVWDLSELEAMRVERGIPTSLTPIKMDVRLQIR